MPLLKGHSQRVVSQNIKEMMEAGHNQKQAIAASLANARKYKKMAHGGLLSEYQPISLLKEQTYEEEYEREEEKEEEEEKEQEMNQGGYAKGGHPKKMARGGEVVEGKEHTLGGMSQKPLYGGMSDYEPLVREDRFKGGKNEPMSEMDRKDPSDYMRGLVDISEEGKSYPNEVSNPNEMEEDRMFANALMKRSRMALSPENFAEGGLVQDGPQESQRLHGNRPELGWINDGTEEPKSSMPMRPDGLEYTPKEREPSGPGLSQEAKEAILRKRRERRYGSYDPSA